MHLRTLRKTIGGHFPEAVFVMRLCTRTLLHAEFYHAFAYPSLNNRGVHFRTGSFCYAFVYPHTFAYGNLTMRLCTIRKTIGGHFRLGSFWYASVYR